MKRVKVGPSMTIYARHTRGRPSQSVMGAHPLYRHRMLTNAIDNDLDPNCPIIRGDEIALCH